MDGRPRRRRLKAIQMEEIPVTIGPSAGLRGPSVPSATLGPERQDLGSPPEEHQAAHPRLGSSRYGYTYRRLLLVSDLAAVLAAGVFATLVSDLAGFHLLESQWLVPFVLFVPVWMIVAHGVGLFHLPERRIDHSFADELGPVFMGATVWIWLFVITKSAIFDGRALLLAPTLLWIGIIVFVLGFRAIARRVARNREWYRRPAVLIGDRGGTDLVWNRLTRHPEWGIFPVATINHDDRGFVIDRLSGEKRGESSLLSEAQRIDQAAASEISRAVIELDADRAIVAGGSSNLAERTALIRQLVHDGITVDYISGEPETLYSAAVLHHLEGLPVLSLQPTTLKRTSAAFKRSVDVGLSAIGLVALAPAFLTCALVVRLGSPGPILFRQARVGRQGERFQMLKFRTMVDGADQMREQMREQFDPDRANGMLKLREDPRITRSGTWMRRWSLDELPQLWNVLRGDMSLVGPRPLPVDEAHLVTDHFTERMRVRPGITGPWQINGRSDIPFEEMVKLDYTYVVGWSMREDLRLMVKTLGVVFRGRGAY